MSTRMRMEIKGLQKVQAANLKLIAAADGLAGDVGEVFIDPGAVNPRSGRRPAEYGVYEHRRGGSHAFFERTVNEAGASIMSAAMRTRDWRNVVKHATIGAHRQAVARVHVDTGSLRAAVHTRLRRRG